MRNVILTGLLILLLIATFIFGIREGQKSILKKQPAFHSLWNTIEATIIATTIDNKYFHVYVKGTNPPTIWRRLDVRIENVDSLKQYLENPPKDTKKVRAK